MFYPSVREDGSARSGAPKPEGEIEEEHWFERDGQPIVLRTQDVGEAEHVGARIYHPHHIDVLQRSHPFGFDLHAAHVGPFTLGAIEYEEKVRVACPDLEAYQVNVALSGAIETTIGQEELGCTSDLGVVYSVDRTASLTGWDMPCQLFALKIERRAMEETLAGLLNRGEVGRISFSPRLDLTAGRARDWWQLVRSVASQAELSELLADPLVARPLAQSLMTGLLLASDHSYRADLDKPGLEATPRFVQEALEVIEAFPDEPLTVVDIARRVGIGVRALQTGFRRHVGSTPTAYLRQVRLARARGDLLRCDPGKTGVAEIAFRWGFTHLGRFAAQYQQAYGEVPSQTLTRNG